MTVENSVKAVTEPIFRDFETKVGKHIEALNIDIKELKNIIVKKRSAEDQAEIVTFDELLRKHNVKSLLDPTDEQPFCRPVFKSKESFDIFDADEEHFMKNEAFVKDLRKYFFTTIKVNASLLDETKEILRKFFNGPTLHNYFTGSKPYKNKTLLSNTTFGKVLADCLVREFKGQLMKRKVGRSVVETLVDEKEVWSAIGKACTDAADWDGGRKSRDKVLNDSTNLHNYQSS